MQLKLRVKMGNSCFNLTIMKKIKQVIWKHKQVIRSLYFFDRMYAILCKGLPVAPLADHAC